MPTRFKSFPPVRACGAPSHPTPSKSSSSRPQRDRHDIRPLVIHDSYLINLAAPPSEIREKSIDAFQGEIERALLIGAEYLVAHPGNYKGLTVEQGILNVAEGMILAWRNVDPDLAQNASSPSCSKTPPEQVRNWAANWKNSPPSGLSSRPTSTCRSAIASTPATAMSPASTWQARPVWRILWQYAEETLGLENVPVFHANDAKTPLGSHLDRHANIGAGYIGLEGFPPPSKSPQVVRESVYSRDACRQSR